MIRKGRPPRLQYPTAPIGTEPVTKAAFWRLLECRKASVTEWVERGIITPPALTTHDLIVPTLAVAQLEAAGRFAPRDAAKEAVAAIASGTAAPGVTYDQARTATEVLKAHVALLDLRARREELIEAEVADGVVFDCMRAVRDAWQIWPARVVAQMATRLKVDPAALLSELERTVRVQLTELADPRADWRRRSEARLGKAQ